MWKIVGIIVVGVSLTLVGDIFLKRSNGFARPSDLLIGLLFYGAASIPVVLAFKYADFSSVFIIWEAIVVVLAVVVGRTWFGETISTDRCLAVILALAAALLAHR